MALKYSHSAWTVSDDIYKKNSQTSHYLSGVLTIRVPISKNFTDKVCGKSVYNECILSLR